MLTEIWVNIGSGSDLLPDGTKSLPEPMLTYHHWSQVTSIKGQLWCQLTFLKETFCHNGSAVFSKMPQICLGCPYVYKRQGMDTMILWQHRPFMSIESFVQHSGWQNMVSLCSLIHLIGMYTDRDQPEFLCSRSDSSYLRVHVATVGGC